MKKQSPQLLGDILEGIQRKALDDDPEIHYIKTERGRLAVQYIDPFSGREETLMLKGDVTDPDADLTDAMIPLYTKYDIKFFEKKNRKLIETGKLAPHTPELMELQRINAISEDELQEVMEAPFFTMRSRLNQFTSPAPVERALRMAQELNRPVKTIEFIKACLAELQGEN